MHSKHVRSLVFSAMLAAVVFIATWIQVPAPLGNVNLGDAAILLGAWIVGGPWSIAACALGSALTDLISGYAIYAPATLLIKALTALVAISVKGAFRKRRPFLAHLFSALSAELVMVLGYFLYEGIFLYGFPTAAIAIPFNLVQGAICTVVALPIPRIFSKIKTFRIVDR